MKRKKVQGKSRIHAQDPKLSDKKVIWLQQKVWMVRNWIGT